MQGAGGPQARRRSRRHGRSPCVSTQSKRPAARCPRAAESPRPGRGLHRRGRGCEKMGSEQDGEDLGEGQPTKERQHIGGNGIDGGIAAHRLFLVIGAGQQVGIGGSLNAGDRQLQ